eukprot:10682185-Karenia_brevis.AAC.1
MLYFVFDSLRMVFIRLSADPKMVFDWLLKCPRPHGPQLVFDWPQVFDFQRVTDCFSIGP